MQLIPGSTVVVVEDIVNRSIISDIQPIEIKLKLDGEHLKVYHKIQNKLIQVFSKQNEIEHLKKAYYHIG
ncbi:hypothetical protein ACFLSE_07920, partial [Bacteroidota bacterium]